MCQIVPKLPTESGPGLTIDFGTICVFKEDGWLDQSRGWADRIWFKLQCKHVGIGEWEDTPLIEPGKKIVIPKGTQLRIVPEAYR